MKFVASVAGTVEETEWSVLESDGGTIDATGTYTAPESEGDYTVVVSFKSLNITESTAVRVKRNIEVNVNPSAATLGAGDSVALTATARGNVKTVTWSVAEAPAGGTVTSAGVYTAPETAGTYTVVATSTADPSKSALATITVTAQPPPPSPLTAAVAVGVAPQTASIVAGTTLQLAASITGSSNVGVTWSVAQAAGGTVTPTGLYTAPATAGTYQVVARSQADTTKSASATITVSAPTPPPTTATDFVDPKSYGAIGDGVTDDTAAFQAAANTKKPLRITKPSVRYRVTASIKVYNSVIGDGSMPEIRMDSPSGDWGDTIFQILGYAGTGATFSGLHLNGGWNGTESMEHSHGIGIGGSSNVTVENNLMQNMRGDNVYIGSNPMGSTGPGSKNITVRNNDLRNPRRCNIAVINANGVMISGNQLQKGNTFVTAIDVEPNPNGSDSTWNVTIDRNTFNSPNAVGVMTYHAPNWPNPPGGLVGGNITISNNSGDVTTGVVIVSSSEWGTITQTNNTWR